MNYGITEICSIFQLYHNSNFPLQKYACVMPNVCPALSKDDLKIFEYFLSYFIYFSKQWIRKRDIASYLLTFMSTPQFVILNERKKGILSLTKLAQVVRKQRFECNPPINYCFLSTYARSLSPSDITLTMFVIP